MKLIIDIDEEYYNYAKQQVADGITNPFKIYISNGTPIPDNATNGDVIKAMFPDNVFAEDKWRDENGVTWHTDIISDNGMTFTDFWWNAPYQKGGKDEAN